MSSILYYQFDSLHLNGIADLPCIFESPIACLCLGILLIVGNDGRTIFCVVDINDAFSAVETNVLAY